MIRFDQVCKSFDGGKRKAVDGVSFDVREKETLVLLGSSGCGKTTLLRMINGLEEPTSGRILVGGTEVARQDAIELRRRIGYVFQGIGLFPHKTVEENLTMVPRLLGWSKDRRARRAAELFDFIGLEARRFARRFPDELSGGEQQRVGVGMALAADPDYLLMDEPFGALDALTRESLQQQFVDINASRTRTILFVTHDIFEALKLGDRIAVMHEGRLEQIGSGEEILTRPRTEFVRDLFGGPARQLSALRGSL